MTDCPSVHPTADIVISNFLIFGIILSYFPQYWKIIKSGSINGISDLTLFFASLTTYFNMIGTLFFDAHYFGCCQDLNYSTSQCLNILLPFFQIGAGWLSNFTFYLLFMIYLERESELGSIKSRTWIRFRYYIYLICFLGMPSLIGNFLLLSTDFLSIHVKSFGATLNILAAICCSVTMIPQIIMTYRNKNIGNYSLITLGLQFPGSFFIVIYQIVINKNNFTVAIPYIVAGIQQMILFFMGIKYAGWSCDSFWRYLFQTLFGNHANNSQYQEINGDDVNF